MLILSTCIVALFGSTLILYLIYVQCPYLYTISCVPPCLYSSRCLFSSFVAPLPVRCHFVIQPNVQPNLRLPTLPLNSFLISFTTTSKPYNYLIATWTPVLCLLQCHSFSARYWFIDIALSPP